MKKLSNKVPISLDNGKVVEMDILIIASMDEEELAQLNECEEFIDLGQGNLLAEDIREI